MMKTILEKGRTQLCPEGELTINMATEFRNSMIDSLKKSDRVEIELSEVTSIDLACLQILCAAHRTAIKAGKDLSMSPPDVPALTEARKQAGFVFNKSCRLAPDSNCLWAGGIAL